LSWLRNGRELLDMSRNPWVRESRAYQRLQHSHAIVWTHASDQSARNPRHEHGLGLNPLWNMSYSCIGCATEGNCPKWPGIHWSVKALLFNDLSLPTQPYARKPPIRVRETRDMYIALDRINFGIGLSLVLVAHRGRTDPNSWESMGP
jgi:hypothetical protein